MKIAILSCLEYTVPGGAERFFIDMATALNATIVCLSYDPNLSRLYPRASMVHFESLEKKLPAEPWRQVAGMRLFRSLNLEYDFYIVTDDMALHYLRRNIPHLYFMLTPRRALYDMYYPTLDEKNLFPRLLFSIILHYVRYQDRRFVQKHVRSIAGISHNVRNRIWKAYGRDADVIYPPIHMEKNQTGEYGDFWLCVSRVDKWKRVDLIVEAFRQMSDIPLIIAGKIYPAYEYLLRAVPSNVRFLGSVPDDELETLYRTCRGFVTMAIDEDYGLTPLEAMGWGKPVVAAKEGGYLETVIDGYTGCLVSPTVECIIRAVKEIDSDPARYHDACIRQAETFDYKVFKEQITTYLERLTK